MDRPWGKWTRLYMDDQVELRLLEVEPGGYCTLHRHEHQANVFIVLAGTLNVRVSTRRDGTDAEALHILNVHEAPLKVWPWDTHQFKAESGRVIAYELNIATGPNPLDPSDSIQLGPAGRDKQ